MVREGFEKGQQVGAVVGRQGDLVDEVVLVGVGAPVAGMRAGGDVAATGCIELQHFLQRRDAAVMHVGAGDFHIAQAGRAELAHVLEELGQFVDAPVGLGEGAGAADVVEARVVERGLDDAAARVHDLVVEVEAAVAVEAFGLFAEEQVHAALLGRVQCRAALEVLVIFAVARKNGALERRDGVDHIAPGDGRCLSRVGLGEARAIARVGSQPREDFLLVVVVDAHLHRVRAEQRRLHLLFKRDQRGVGPGQRGVVDHVGQALGVARMCVPRGAQ